MLEETADKVEDENLLDQSDNILDSTDGNSEDDQEVNGDLESDESQKPDIEDSESSDSENEDPDSDEDGELLVSIGEESPPQEDSGSSTKLVKHLRKVQRETAKTARNLKKELEELKKKSLGVELKPQDLGRKPKLEDFDYDSDKFESELSSWYERKQELDRKNAEIKNQQEVQEKQWQERLDNYSSQKEKLKVRDYEESEFNVQETLSQTQQGIIIQGADNPALVTYALGKNSKELEKLSKIVDPVKFSFAVSKLETKLKVTNKRKPSSSPEKVLSGNLGTSSGGNYETVLQRLRDEALKTGDYSKVMEYKKRFKEK